MKRLEKIKLKNLERLNKTQNILAPKLWNCLSKVKSVELNLDFTHEIWRDIAFWLEVFCQHLLATQEDENLKRIAVDGCLLEEVTKSHNNILSFCGAIIRGFDLCKVDPFYFEIELGSTEGKFIEYSFLLGDLEKPSISYEKFSCCPHYWYPCARYWKYVINKKAN